MEYERDQGHYDYQVTEPWYRNETAIKISRYMFLVWLIAGVLVLVAALLMKKSTDDREATRALETSVVFVHQRAPVSLDVDISGLPDCMPETRVPTNLVLVLDKSGSMKGIPFERELEGARRLVSEMDFSSAEVAVVLFDNEVRVLSDWSDSQSNLTTRLNSSLAAGNGTDIALGLAQANELLEEQSAGASERNFVLLFTDGGSDKDAAVAQADELKAKGARLFVVGLQGGDFDRGLLQAIVSAPSDLFITDDPEQLVELFGEVSDQIQIERVKDLRAGEPINSRVFSVPESDPAETGPKFLEAEDITENQIHMAYEVRPQRIGVFNVVNPGGTISFFDCEETRHVYALPEGPRLIVLPPLFALMLLYGLPLVLFGLFGFLPRPPEKILRQPDNSPDYSEPAFTAAALGGAKMEKEVRTEEHLFDATLVIGLGDVGFETLNLLKKSLLEFGEGRMPAGVQLLWVGANPPEFDDLSKRYLDRASEIHAVRPEYDRINIAVENPGISSPFSWWSMGSTQKEDRLHGRMMFFYDVLFSPAKSLRKIFESIANRFLSQGHSTYRVFVVSSPAESESAMLSDFVYWMRSRFGKQISRVLPWMLLKPSDRRDVDSETASRRFAAMRETQRFLIAPNQLMESEDGNFAVQDGFLYDGCMLYDQSSNPGADRQSLLESIVDQMLLLMEDDVAQAFDQELTEFVGTVSNLQDKSLFITSNSFTFYLPVEPIRRACEVRLLNDLFFAEKKSGQVPSGLFSELTEKERSTDETGLLFPEALEFLHWRCGDLENNLPFQLLAELVEHGWDEGVVDYFPRNLLDGFRWKLMVYLNDLMNGRSLSEDFGKSASISRAEAFLSQLFHLLNSADQLLDELQPVPGKEHAARSLKLAIPGFKDSARMIRKELEAWMGVARESTVNKTLTASNRFRRSQSPIREVESLDEREEGNLLKHDLTHLYQNKLKELEEALVISDTRTVVLDPQFNIRDQVHADDIVDYYYREYLLDADDKGNNKLSRLTSDVGWHWDTNEGGEPLLKFLLGKEDVDQGDFPGSIQTLMYEREDLAKLLQDLLTKAPDYSRVLREKMDLVDLLRHQEREVSAILDREKDDRLLRYQLINDPGYCIQRPYLLHPDTTQARAWASQLSTQRLEIKEIKNNSRATAIWFVYKVPASIIEQLKSDETFYYPTRDIHVFPAEQYAVEKEVELGIKPGGDELLHPRLVRMMNFPELFEFSLFAIIYGWLRTVDDELGVYHYVLESPSVPECRLECKEVHFPKNLEDALLNITIMIPWKCLDDSHPLHMNNLHRTLKALYADLSNIRSRPYEERQKRFLEVESRIQSWRESKNAVEKDLARILAVMIEKERRY